MNLFSKLVDLFELVFGRAVVRRQNLPLMFDYLINYLREQGFHHTDRITTPVGTIILEEALRRAAEKEKDGQARTKIFIQETTLAADSIIAAFNGDENADPRIRSILAFHKVLLKPNPSNARPEPPKE
jgi:hypothetical protein